MINVQTNWCAIHHAEPWGCTYVGMCWNVLHEGDSFRGLSHPEVLTYVSQILFQWDDCVIKHFKVSFSGPDGRSFRNQDELGDLRAFVAVEFGWHWPFPLNSGRAVCATHVATQEGLLPCLCCGPAPSWIVSSSRAEDVSDSYLLFPAKPGAARSCQPGPNSVC